MSDNNLSVKITADIVDLQTKFAVAKAEVNGLTSEMNKLAKASATGTIDAAGTARLKQFAGDLLAARQASQGYAAELDKAGFSVSSFGQKMEGGHGSISTATREFRALFDELSSGRTRQTPGTLAIIAQRVIGLGPAALGAVAGVVGLVGGLALLTARSIQTANALDQIRIGANFAGNFALSAEAIKQFTDELARAHNISGSAAREIMGSFAAMHDTTVPQMHALTAIIADFAQVTGQEAPKAADELAKAFSAKTTAAEYARTLGGVSQAQINIAESADKSGDANQVFSAKLELLNSTLDHARSALDQHNASITASAKNWFGYFGALSAGESLEEAETQSLKDQNDARGRQVQLLAQARAEIASTPASRDQTLKTGVGTAEKENPVALQIETAKSKIGEMNAALAIAQERGDQISIDKLNAGLAKANENLSNLQFGPVLERMREQMAQVAATWDGTQSGMLAKQIQVAQGTLASVQQNAKERVQVETEIAHLEVQQRQAAGAQLIAEARAQVAAINGETSIGAIARLEAERDVWVQTLTGERLTGTQRLEVARSINQDLASIEKERQTQSQAIARSDADTDIAIARLKISERRAELQEDVAADRASSAQKATLLKDLVNQEFALNKQALDAELGNLKSQPVEYEHVYNQIRELKAKQALDIAKIDKQAAQEAARAAKEQASAWAGAVNEIESVESRLVSDVINRRQSMSRTLQQVSLELVTKEIANDLRGVTTRVLLANTEEAQKKALSQGGYLYHLLFEHQKTAQTTASETARTSAATAAAATRTAAATSEAAAQRGVAIATGVAQIGTDAAVAAAGAAASVAAIPLVGWVMAPEVAAATYASTMAYTGLASLDVGTNYVPHDMTARIHKGEAVVPKAYNPAAGGGGGAGGGDIHMHNNFSGLDGASIANVVSSGAFHDAIKDMAARYLNRGGR